MAGVNTLLRCCLAAAVVLCLGSEARAQLYDFSSVTATAERLVREQNLPGAVLAIVRDNQVLYKQAFGTYTFSTQVQTASSAKWLTAVAMATVVERGQLSWQSKVGDYFAGLPANKASMTLEQLMSFTSGINNADDAPCLNDRTVSLDACAKQILALPLSVSPARCSAMAATRFRWRGEWRRLPQARTGI